MADLIRYRVMLPDSDRGPCWTDMWVRAGTSDEDVVNECWVQDVYHVRGLAFTEPPPPLTALEATVDRRPIILDIGACTGIFSLQCAQTFPDAIIEAYEPEAENYALLKCNTEKFNHQIRCFNSGLSGLGGPAFLAGGTGIGHTVGAGEGQQVDTVTLRRVVDGRQIALMKMDVEGAEFDIIGRTPRDTMQLIEHIVMEWHGPGTCPWLDGATSLLYGQLMDTLAGTHAVQVFGDPHMGGYLYAHRYPPKD